MMQQSKIENRKSIPFFIEVLDDAQHTDSHICRRIMSYLLPHNIRPLPFATSLREVSDVLAALDGQHRSPALYVVNTYWADAMLLQLDELIGSTPVLFLRREIYSSETARILLRDSSGNPTTRVLQSMRCPKQVMAYAPREIEPAAAEAAERILQFLHDGDFSRLQRAALAAI